MTAPQLSVDAISESASTDSISDSSKNVNTKFSDRDYTINTSMTMDEAKQMIQRAFVLGGIEEFYEGEYKNGDAWLRGEGASEVALYIENEYTLDRCLQCKKFDYFLTTYNRIF